MRDRADWMRQDAPQKQLKGRIFGENPACRKRVQRRERNDARYRVISNGQFGNPRYRATAPEFKSRNSQIEMSEYLMTHLDVSEFG